MNRIVYMLCLILLSCCGSYGKKPKEIIVNTCESFTADSINGELIAQNIPMKFNKDDAMIKLTIGKYVIMVSDEDGPCFSTIIETPDCYFIILTEYYVVGYDLCFIYNKARSIMYQTDLYNLNYMPYDIQCETFNFKDCTMNVIYEDENTENVHFSKCISDTINLSIEL